MKKLLTLLFAVILFSAYFATIPKTVSGTNADENTWVRQEPMNLAKDDFGVAVVEGKIYALGGDSTEKKWDMFGHNQDYSYGGIVGVSEVFDPETNKWSRIKPMPTPISGFSVVVCQDIIYCIDDRAVMQVYDTKNNSWSETAPKPIWRQNTPQVFQDKVYIIGGSTNEAYDFATDRWENKTAMPYPIEAYWICSLNDKFYFMGGIENHTFINFNQVYDPKTDSWDIKAPLPSDPRLGSLVIFDDKLYFIGSVIQIYDPTTDRWTQGGATPFKPYSIKYVFATSGEWAPKRIYVFNDTLQAYNPETGDWTLCANISIVRSTTGYAVVNDKFYVIGGHFESTGYLFTAEIKTELKKITINDVYTPFGYGTIPLKINVDLPNGRNYLSNEAVAVNFTVSRPVVWMGYSLDGQNIVEIKGNTTLPNLPAGAHSLTIYANDTLGKIGTSETVAIKIAEPFPAMEAAVLSVASILVVCAILLFYFRKLKRNKV
jgi:N-acetylneuraminic acid mutarotase